MSRIRTVAMAAAVGAGLSAPAVAQDFYIGQILLVGFTYCPAGTVEAAGQTLSIASNTPLFALYGTTFGGNGATTFQLPDLQGRAAVGQGAGAGLSPVVMGEKAGAEIATVTQANLPPHTHPAAANLVVSGVPASSDEPSPGAVVAASNIYADGVPANIPLAGGVNVTVGATGQGAPMPIRNPYLGLRYCVVTQGIFPPRP
jgi:microcystin-dependent protein